MKDPMDFIGTSYGEINAVRRRTLVSELLCTRGFR